MAVLHPLDHRAGREEQQRLEECMRDEVEHARHVSSKAHRRHHETQLADRGIGQHALNVILPDSDARREERRGSADKRRQPG